MATASTNGIFIIQDVSWVECNAMTTVPPWQTAVQRSVDSGAYAVSRDCAWLARRQWIDVVSAHSSRELVSNDMIRIRNPSDSSIGVLSTDDAGAASPTTEVTA